MNETRRRAWVKNAIIIFLAIMLILTFFSNTIMNYSLPEVAAQYAQSGRKMRVKIWNSPAPSSLAASIMAVGMRRMNFVKINTAKGEKMPGRMIDQRVSMRCSHSATRKFGTSVT